MANIDLIKLQFQWGKDNMENPLDNMDTEDFDYLLESVDKLKNHIEELEEQLNFEKMTRVSMDSIERYTADIKEENKKLEETLEFYADKINYVNFQDQYLDELPSEIDFDEGERARKVLKK